MRERERGGGRGRERGREREGGREGGREGERLSSFCHVQHIILTFLHLLVLVYQIFAVE